MRVLGLVRDADVIELDVEVLINGFEGAGDDDVIFQLDGEWLVEEGFEEGEEEHFWVWGRLGTEGCREGEKEACQYLDDIRGSQIKSGNCESHVR